MREMLSASDLEDARMRATRLLEAFEKTVASRTGVITEVVRKVRIYSFAFFLNFVMNLSNSRIVLDECS